MIRPTVTAPAELTLPAVAELLAQFQAAPAGLRVDLRATTAIDLAALQLLLAAARQDRLQLTPATHPPLATVCRAVGIDPAIFHLGDSYD
jgi:anti-anti-sigma regulatory factor